MIRTLVDFALNNKFVVIAIAVLLLGWGAISFHNLPVEAYPDIADNYVTVITQWAGRSAEEVEQQVTIPIEIQMAGMPHMTYLRSESIFGLSFVIMIFDDTSVNDWNRQKVLERLTQVNLPNGQNLQPQIGTDWSTTGQIYWYTLRSTNPQYDLMELRSLEDWVLLKQFKSVPNVVDVSDIIINGLLPPELLQRLIERTREVAAGYEMNGRPGCLAFHQGRANREISAALGAATVPLYENLF